MFEMELWRTLFELSSKLVKGSYMGVIYGSTTGDIKGDTKSHSAW